MAEVCVISVDSVQPQAPTPQPCIMTLSLLQHMAGPFYNKQVYYFPAPPRAYSSDFALLLSQLKLSLAQTLSHYFPLAGRLEFYPFGRAGRRLHVVCNDAGATFRAALARCRLSDWNDLQDCTSIEHLLQPELSHDGIYSPEAPVLNIQVTKFLCGSITLGIAIHESVADGHSAFDFFKSWSEMHKSGTISRLPIFDAELLKPRHPPMVTVPIRDYIPFNVSSSSYVKRIEGGAPSPYSTRLFTFTADNVEALVQEVRNGEYGHEFPDRGVSTFEAVGGLLWKCLTEARELADEEATIFNYTVSLKGNIDRWQPRIPENYFGNTVHATNLTAKARDLKGNDVSYTAWLLHQDIHRITVEEMKSNVDWMQMQMEEGLNVVFNGDFYSGKVVEATSVHAFPVYAMDFGWGRPLHFSYVMNPWHEDGEAILLPTPERGRSRRLLVGVPQAHLDKLSKHPLFLAFTTPTNIPPNRITSLL